MKDKLVSEDFIVPKGMNSNNYKIRMLTIDDVDKDYEAVMSSIDHLHGVFGERSSWPSSELTLKQDLIDLGWHQKEFQMKSSFAYTIMKPDESKCIGCMYIFPSKKKDYEVEIYVWVTKIEFDKGLDPIIFSDIKNWIDKDWQFKKVAYPGREIKWEEWGKLLNI